MYYGSEPDSPPPVEGRCLSQRRKNVDIYLLPPGKQFRVVAEMQDRVHHMRMAMVVNQPSLRICQIDCEMLQVPDELCRRALSFFDPLVGQRVAAGIIRHLKPSAHKGCTHLTDLFREACYNLPMAQAQLGEEQLQGAFPGLTEAQLYKIFLWFKPDLKNSCVRYAADSPFMTQLPGVKLPPGAKNLKATATK